MVSSITTRWSISLNYPIALQRQMNYVIQRLVCFTFILHQTRVDLSKHAVGLWFNHIYFLNNIPILLVIRCLSTQSCMHVYLLPFCFQNLQTWLIKTNLLLKKEDCLALAASAKMFLLELLNSVVCNFNVL